MSEDCSKIGCAVPKNAVQEYLNQYSLNQVIVTNNEFTAVINGVTYTIPAGTFSLSITSDTTFPLSYQGCQSNVSAIVPPGSTIGQIQALAQSLLQQVAAQQAQCNAAASNPVSSTFVNSQITYDPACSVGSRLWISEGFPSGIRKVGNDLIVPSGIFSSSVSIADANSKASAYLNNAVSKLVSDGAIWCTCPDSNIIDSVEVSFPMPAIGGTETIQVSNSSHFHVNNPVDPLNGKFYVAFTPAQFNAMWFSVDSIPDPTHITVRRTNDLGLFPVAGTTMISGSFISNGTNPNISSGLSQPAQTQTSFSFSDLIVDCGGCFVFSGTPWDGKFFPSQLSTGGGLYQFIKYQTNGGFLNRNSLSVNATIISYNHSTQPFFFMSIWCTDGANPVCPLWGGIKYSGNTPIGTYYNTGGEKTCVVVS